MITIFRYLPCTLPPCVLCLRHSLLTHYLHTTYSPHRTPPSTFQLVATGATKDANGSQVDDGGSASQHQGFGRRLLAEAEVMARRRGYTRMAVISGVGTRQYYRKHGYEIAPGPGDFMVKPLPGVGLWLWSQLLTLLAHLAAVLLWLGSMPSTRTRASLRRPPPEAPGEFVEDEDEAEPWPESLPEAEPWPESLPDPVQPWPER